MITWWSIWLYFYGQTDSSEANDDTSESINSEINNTNDVAIEQINTGILQIWDDMAHPIADDTDSWQTWINITWVDQILTNEDTGDTIGDTSSGAYNTWNELDNTISTWDVYIWVDENNTITDINPEDNQIIESNDTDTVTGGVDVITGHNEQLMDAINIVVNNNLANSGTEDNSIENENIMLDTGSLEIQHTWSIIEFVPEHPHVDWDIFIQTPNTIAHVNQSGFLDPQTVSSYTISQDIMSDYPAFSSFVARHNLMWLSHTNQWSTGWSSGNTYISMGNAVALIIAGTETNQLSLVSSIEDLNLQLDHLYVSWFSIGELYLYQSNDSILYSNPRYNQGHRVVIFYGSDGIRYVLDPILGNTTSPIILEDYIASTIYTSYGINKYGYQVSDIYQQAKKQVIWPWCIYMCGQTYCEDDKLIGKTYFSLEKAELKNDHMYIKWAINVENYQVSVCLSDQDDRQQLWETDIMYHSSEKNYKYQLNTKIDDVQHWWAHIILHDKQNKYIGLHWIPLSQ